MSTDTPSWHSSRYYSRHPEKLPMPTIQGCNYKETERQRRQNETIATGLAIVFGLLPWGYSMPVAYKWPLWAIAFVSVLYLCVTSIPWLASTFSEAPRRYALLVCVTALVVVIFWPIMYGQWKTENAALLEGDLHPLEQSYKAPHRILEIGDARFDWEGDKNAPMVQGLYNAGLLIQVNDKNELDITTPIRDRSGRLVAKLEHNHWSVTSACLDKNYTKDSLEIVDARGMVIFQATLLADRVRLQGEWRDEFGNGFRISADPKGGALFSGWKSPEGEQKEMIIIRPMFKYPSANHWRELVG
jgi:hypothetical protein